MNLLKVEMRSWIHEKHICFSLIVIPQTLDINSNPSKQSSILFTFTSSAIFLTVGIFISLVISFDASLGWPFFLTLLGAVCYVPPALRLDEVFHKSISLPLIPIGLGYIALGISIIATAQGFHQDSGFSYLEIMLVYGGGYFSSLASFLLFIFKFDGFFSIFLLFFNLMFSSSPPTHLGVITIGWTLVVIPFLVSAFLFTWLLGRFADEVYRCLFASLSCFVLILFVVTPTLLIALRTDDILSFSYHYCFTPFFLAAVGVGVIVFIFGAAALCKGQETYKYNINHEESNLNKDHATKVHMNLLNFLRTTPQ